MPQALRDVSEKCLGRWRDLWGTSVSEVFLLKRRLLTRFGLINGFHRMVEERKRRHGTREGLLALVFGLFIASKPNFLFIGCETFLEPHFSFTSKDSQPTASRVKTLHMVQGYKPIFTQGY